MAILFSRVTYRKVQSNKFCYYICHHVCFRCRIHTANKNYFNILFRCSGAWGSVVVRALRY